MGQPQRDCAGAGPVCPFVLLARPSESRFVSINQNMRITPLFAYVPLVLFLALDPPLLAADHGTATEAKAMLVKAITHYKAVGRKQALADFTANKPPFGDRDLYVVCFNSERIVVANGGFPGYVGTRGDTVVDENGKGVGAASWEATSASGEGVVQYRWVNPVTRDVEAKTMFVARIGGDVCGVGNYVRQ